MGVIPGRLQALDAGDESLMILALLTAARRRVACALGRHEWVMRQYRRATRYEYLRDYSGHPVWIDTGVRAWSVDGLLGDRVCQACQRHEIEVFPGKWVVAARVRDRA